MCKSEKMISAGKEPNTTMLIAAFIAIAAAVFTRATVFAKETNCNLQKTHQITIEDRAKLSPLVLHTLAVYTNPLNLSAADQQSESTFPYSAHFWLISVYKGAEDVARYFKIPDIDDVVIYNIHDRYVL